MRLLRRDALPSILDLVLQRWWTSISFDHLRLYGLVLPQGSLVIRHRRRLLLSLPGLGSLRRHFGSLRPRTWLLLHLYFEIYNIQIK